MVHVLEAGMLICFGLSWPFNISKSLRSRTAKGKSVVFEILVIVGYLCGLEGFSAAEEPAAGSFSDEMLVLCGLTGAQLDALLSALRRSRELIPLKAVVTEDNAAWSSIKLHDELFREHEAMKSVRAKDAKNRSPHRK